MCGGCFPSSEGINSALFLSVYLLICAFHAQASYLLQHLLCKAVHLTNLSEIQSCSLFSRSFADAGINLLIN